ncbi:MAG: hypothetical protein AAF527_08300 [Pseudomonadota bacterium]
MSEVITTSVFETVFIMTNLPATTASAPLDTADPGQMTRRQGRRPRASQE